MSKLEAIISRKRSSSPSQGGAGKRANQPGSFRSKHGNIEATMESILRQQYLMSRLSPLAPIIAGVNINNIAQSTNGQAAGLPEEGSPVAPGTCTGIPRPAPANQRTAPVHIDVGGMNYTSTLETLTKYPESRLAMLFNGTIPVVLDSFKQAYFLDRDGPSFQYILNFLRNGELKLPDDFQGLGILETEARYFGLDEMVQKIGQFRKDRATDSEKIASSTAIVFVHVERDDSVSQIDNGRMTTSKDQFECASQSIKFTDEVVYLTGSADILQSVFPEFIQSPTLRNRSSQINATEGNNKNSDHVERVRLERIPSTEVLARFAEHGFNVCSTSVIHRPDLNRHTVEYALLLKRQ